MEYLSIYILRLLRLSPQTLVIFLSSLSTRYARWHHAWHLLDMPGWKAKKQRKPNTPGTQSSMRVNYEIIILVYSCILVHIVITMVMTQCYFILLWLSLSLPLSFYRIIVHYYPACGLRSQILNHARNIHIFMHSLFLTQDMSWFI